MGRKGSQAVTIRAVARHAGVSAMTVSNVLNGAGGAGADTIARVQAAIAELGYVPNLSARRLAKARATTVGLLYGNGRTPFLDAVLIGTLRATNAHGLQLVVRECAGDTAQDALGQARDLVRSGADALLLIPPIAELLAGSALADAVGVPLAAVATGDALPGMATVRIDNRAAMARMVDTIIGGGCSRIGYVAGPDDHSVVPSRLNGYFDALAGRSIAPDPTLVVRGGRFDHESGMAAGRALLSLPQPPGAIVCSSDDLAAGVIAEAARMGLALPSQLGVTGFDDTVLASRIWPALSVVRQPVEEMAFRATRSLIAALDSGKPCNGDEVVDHEIIWRASLVPADGQGSGARGVDHPALP